MKPKPNSLKRIASRLFLSATLLAASGAMADTADFSRKPVHLSQATDIGGLFVEAGDIEVFEPGGQLAKGTLAQGATVQLLELPAGATIDRETPDRLATVQLPPANPIWMTKLPFEGASELRFGYGPYLVTLRAKMAYHPDQYPGFPTAGLEKKAFDNEVTAKCEQSLRSPNKKWSCHFQIALQSPLEHTFGHATQVIPEGTRISFTIWGIEQMTLSHDQMFLGFPVSAAHGMRVGPYHAGGPVIVNELWLSREFQYGNALLSPKDSVQFFEPSSSGAPRLSSFVPANDYQAHAAGQSLTLAAFKRVNLNEDGSLRYGELAFPQRVQGNLYPEGALLFFGNQDGTPLESAGLLPFTKVIINGVSYGDSVGKNRLFLDFDEQGRVIRVR